MSRRLEEILGKRLQALFANMGREPTDEELWESFTTCPVCGEESLEGMSREEKEAHITECAEGPTTIHLDRTRDVRRS